MRESAMEPNYRIDVGMPATLVVGNREMGCFIVDIDGERMRFGGAEEYSRIDRVAVIPWRSPYESEEEEMEALRGILDDSVGTSS